MQKPLSLTRPSYSKPRLLPFALGGGKIAVPNPYPRLVAGELKGVRSKPKPIYACQTHTHTSHGVNAWLSNQHKDSTLIKACQDTTTTPFVPVLACQDGVISTPVAVYACVNIMGLGFKLLDSVKDFAVSATDARHTCASVFSPLSLARVRCTQSTTLPTHSLGVCLNAPGYKAVPRHTCQAIHMLPATPVPCRHYPVLAIAEEPPFACPPPPAADRLPFGLTQGIAQAGTHAPAYVLPMHFVCKGAVVTAPADPANPKPKPSPSPNSPSTQPPASTHIGVPSHHLIHIPTLRAYIMHHTIQAQIGNVPVSPLAFDIQTDISSFCWQGQIELSLTDYQVIKETLPTTPAVRVTLDGIDFVFLSEETTHQRRFGHDSIVLSGRSVPALLSQDYAYAKALPDTDLYAS